MLREHGGLIRSRLAWFWLVLGDTEDRSDLSGQWYNELPLDTWLESPIFQWLREQFLPNLINKPAEDPEPDEDDASGETLLPK